MYHREFYRSYATPVHRYEFRIGLFGEFQCRRYIAGDLLRTPTQTQSYRLSLYISPSANFSNCANDKSFSGLYFTAPQAKDTAKG